VNELRPGAETRRFGRTASLLSAGVGAAGLLTYLFFSLASHNLDSTQYGEIVVLWSAVFVTISVAHRPVEQMLSRTIAERRARGEEIGSALRVGVAIQLGVAALLGILALAFREPLQDGLLSGSETLYWVLVFSVVAFGVSYYARGALAGTRRFALLAGLLVCESAARTGFALAVALGIAEGQEAVALGVAAAPAISLAAVPVGLLVLRSGRDSSAPASAASPPPVTVAAGGGFAAAVLVVMLSEQAFLNAGPLLVRAFEDAAAAGFIFNVLMVVRAPVLVFQGVATSLLPHLTRLRARGSGGEDAFHQSVRATLFAIACFAALALALVAAVGPEAMQIAFGDEFDYDRLGLMTMAVAMGFYLAATTLSQAALAHGAAARSARCWAVSAALFLAWCLIPLVDDEARRVEVGFLGGAILLALLLARVYRTVPSDGIGPDSPEEIEARLAAADEAG
jgi:O-antigen/teichoic acid export membrane protein